MTNILPDHPAVKAALLAGYGQSEDTFAPEMAYAINAAIEELTADDLRDTPVGGNLKAEGWTQAIDLLDATEFTDAANHLRDHNPYRDDAAMSDCVFCQIVAGDAPAEIVRRGLHSLVIRPLNPVVEGHVICLPYEHVEDAASDPRITMLTMGELAQYAEIQRSTGNTQEFNLITSAGRSATQSVFHLHIHYVPRAHRDGLALPWHSGIHTDRH